MPAYDSVIFDLDGTLWDVSLLATQARNDVLKKLGITRTVTRDEVIHYIGMPADEIYTRLFPELPVETRVEIRRSVTALIAERLPKEGARLFPGVVEGLASLKRKYPLFIVSNCAPGCIENFLQWSKLGHLVSDHECYGKTLESKGRNIRRVVERNSLENPVYVGDTDGDESAAQEAGVAYLHVDYGFGRPKGSPLRFGSFEELVKALLK